MISTDNGRMIIMSSQILGHANRDFINVSSLRSSHIISNHVHYVCPPHLKKMTTDHSIGNLCLCNIFSQPYHIKTGGSFKALAELFASDNPRNNDANTSSSMLSELGIDLSLINEDIQDIAENALFTRKAHIHLQTNSICIKKLLKELPPGTTVSNTVMVYVDPAPVTSDMSYNALCFVTCITHNVSNILSQNYVIIAIENFKSDMIDSETNDYGIATATILMQDINDIYSYFGGHFKNFIIAPEADSISMDQFWLHCQHLYLNYTKMHKVINKPDIYFTTISQPLTKQNKEELSTQFHLKRKQAGLTPINSNEIPRKRRNGIGREHEENTIIRDKTTLNYLKYRIGYNLGHEKTKLYVDFIFKRYNTLNVFCASEIFSRTMFSNEISLPTFITQNLDVLALKPPKHKGEKWKITGKRQKKGEYITDDVADAVIMSIMLFPTPLGDERWKTPFYKLNCEDNKKDRLHQYQSTEYTITTPLSQQPEHY